MMMLLSVDINYDNAADDIDGDEEADYDAADDITADAYDADTDDF